MNKLIITLLSVLFFTPQIGFTASCCLLNPSIEARVTAFCPTSRTFQKIYGNVNPSYELQGNFDFGSMGYENFEGWINFDWFERSKKSIGFKDKTRVEIATTSLGINYRFSTCGIIVPYIGLGPTLAGIWLHNRTDCSPKHPSKWAWGLVVKTGFNFDIAENVFIDLFVDYVYQPVSFKTRQDIGGFKPGIGLGYRF